MKLDLMRRHTARPPSRTRRLRRTLTARLMALSLLPLLVSYGVPVSTALAQPMRQPQEAPPPSQDLGGQSGPGQSGPGQSGPIIRSIEFQGNSMLPDETLRYYLGLETGQALDEDKLNESIRELWDRSLVDDIQVATTPAADGVNLVITIKERPILRSISYEGLKRISKTDIQDKLST